MKNRKNFYPKKRKKTKKPLSRKFIYIKNYECKLTDLIKKNKKMNVN